MEIMEKQLLVTSKHLFTDTVIPSRLLSRIWYWRAINRTPKELIDPFAAGGARGGSNDIPPLAEYGSGALKDEEDEVDENGVKSSTA